MIEIGENVKIAPVAALYKKLVTETEGYMGGPAIIHQAEERDLLERGRLNSGGR